MLRRDYGAEVERSDLMTNEEVFRQYGSEKWVVEEVLSYLLLEYWDKHGKRACEEAQRGYRTTGAPHSTVDFVKDFMKEETLVHTDYAEKSKMDSLEKCVVEEIEEGSWREIPCDAPEEERKTCGEAYIGAFPNAKVTVVKRAGGGTFVEVVLTEGVKNTFPIEWWNAPYEIETNVGTED